VTRTEPILAWRIWRLRLDDERNVVEPVLESCVYGDEWPVQEAFSAACPRHDRPVVGCDCGIYAVASRAAALEWARWAQTAVPHPVVVGQVQLWGRVFPHSLGYRAELAYPYALEVLRGEALGEADAARLERGLRDSYLVDVAPSRAA
jgi:hypothetical protein